MNTPHKDELQNQLNELAETLNYQWAHILAEPLKSVHSAHDFYRGMLQTLILLGGKWERDDAGHHKVFLFGLCGEQSAVDARNYMAEYHDALKKREELELYSKEWEKMQGKLFGILRDGVTAHDDAIAQEVANDIESLLDCDSKWDEEEVQREVKLLEENGYQRFVDDIKKLYKIG